MNNEQCIELVKLLADHNLLLIDTGAELTECDIEIHRKKKSTGEEVVLFVAKERD